MKTWTDLLIQHVKKNTHAPKTTDRTDRTPFKTRKSDSCVSFVSTFPDTSQKNYDAESIVERAAIMEYEGDMPRDTASSRAAADADGRRPRAYGDTRLLVAEYENYIQHWQPSGEDDLPLPPPNTPDNGPLWSSFWKIVDGGQNDGKQ